MRKTPAIDKEELYDVIAALSATIRQLTNEIIELHGIMLETNSIAEHIWEEMHS
jgi:hypothetical protein